jgi:diguanylate cyclase (GGDEF)-like protein
MASDCRRSLRTPADMPFSRTQWYGPDGAFVPQMEAEYVRGQLLQSRPLIRTAATLALVIALARIVEQLLGGATGVLLISQYALVLAGSITLAVLAWQPALERPYLPWAQVIVPARNVIVAAHFAAAAARGQSEVLMVLPLMLISPFVFMGLRFRAALLSGVLTVGAFLAAGLIVGVGPALLARSFVLFVVTLLGCAITGRRLECFARNAFLETHLMIELAQRDALTGANNRRVFDEHLADLWQAAGQEHRPIAILLIDIDHFKAYNDRYGHLAGDEALRCVARTLQQSIQGPRDVLARYGGEEFAALLYGLDAQHAQQLAERMRRAVMALSIEHHGQRTQARVTVSIGIAAVSASLERNARGALQLADQALYEAKLAGRNRVEVMDDMHYQSLVTGVFRAGIAGHA